MATTNAKAGADIRFSGVTKVYRTSAQDVIALDGIDWSAAAGSAVALMGPSGCGKTTLLNLLGGMDRPDSGTININGKDIGSMGERELEHHRLLDVGFVFQFFNLIPSLSAIENIELPAIMAGTDGAVRGARARELLDMVGLGSKGVKRPEELSGGEQQRVAICVALINDPPLILADEPTGNLDTSNADVITRLLMSLATDRGKTVIVSSHDQKVVESFPQVYRMRDGVILGDA